MRAGRRVIAFDNRGHGRSEKLYRPEDYELSLMAADARNLLDHLGVESADVMGYSLGARIATAFALTYAERAKAFVFGGLGGKLLETPGLGDVIARALKPRRWPMSKRPRQNLPGLRRGDEKRPAGARRLARGARRQFTEADLAAVAAPVLVAVGSKDDVAGDPEVVACASAFRQGPRHSRPRS